MDPHGELYDNSQIDYESQNHEDKQDFSYLTIDQLKHRIHAMDVQLDMHKHPKSFYLDIYRETLKDESKRELIQEILDNEHKSFHKKGKKVKVCENFMKNKRKRTEEEDTVKEEENNSNINHINLKLAENVEIPGNLHLDQGESSLNKKIQVKKINFFSITPSNDNTPLVKKNIKIYNDVESPQCMDLKQLIKNNELKQINRFNPLVRILDTDFSQIEKPSTPIASPFNNRRQSLTNNFTFQWIKNDDQMENAEEMVRIISNSPNRPTYPASQGKLIDEYFRGGHPRSFSFGLDNNPQDRNLIKTKITLNSINLPRYLLILLGGSVVICGVYLISEYMPVNNPNFNLMKNIPLIPILIFGVVIIGAFLTILYLLKANTESIKRNNELIGENIFDNIRKNLIEKFNSGDTQPTIDQEEFIEEFCKLNNYEINYFNKNVLPFVKENMIYDQNMDVSEVSFYEDGKIKTLWRLITKELEEN